MYSYPTEPKKKKKNEKKKKMKKKKKKKVYKCQHHWTLAEFSFTAKRLDNKEITSSIILAY